MINPPARAGAAFGVPRVLIFDVNETLLDIDSLAPYFAQNFGNPAMLRTWFGELVMYSMTLTLSGYYIDFFTLGRAVLNMVATARGVDLADADLRELEGAMQTMPAHHDAEPGLRRLQAQGYRLVTLTNSPHRANAPSPLQHSGLAPLFEQQFTVDSLKIYKPTAHLYRQAAADLGVTPSDCMMVAAHTWDVIGANGAGLRGALIMRAGNAALIADGIPKPEIVAADVLELSDHLEAIKHPSNG